LGAACCSREVLAVVSQAQNFNDAVRGYLIDDEMPRFGDTMFPIDEVSCRSEVVRAETGDTRDVTRARQGRGVANCGEGGQDEAVILGGRGHAPTPSAFEQDVVDDVLGSAR
jgi:hypothetical protein